MSRNPITILVEFNKLVNYLRNGNFRLVHVHHRRLLVFAWFLKCVTGVRVIYTSHLAYRWTPSLLPFKIDVAVGISQAVMADIESAISADQFIKIGNPADFDKNYDLTSHCVDPVVVCVARLAPVKNHAYLLRAWKLVLKLVPNAKLMLVGEGELKHSLIELSCDLNIKNSVQFLGYQEDWQKNSKDYLFAILPSFVEGYPVSVIEAAALSLPTLVTDVAGSRDTVPPNCLLANKVSISDESVFASVIVSWLSNPRDVESDGILYRNFHESRNSSRVIAQKYMQYCWSVESATVV